MPETHGEAGSLADLERELGRYGVGTPGPKVLLVAGLHGNEPMGIHAARRVLRRLREERLALRGEVVAFAGNLGALRRGVRYLEHDLNRLWSEEQVRRIRAGKSAAGAEEREMVELLAALEAEFRGGGPALVLDLHTTSSDSAPFLACNGEGECDRGVLRELHVPFIIDIPAYLAGTLFEYLGRHGRTAFVFEAGRHDAPGSIDIHEAAIWLTLLGSGALAEEDVPSLARHRARLAEVASGAPKRLRLVYRHLIRPEDRFEMLPGFSNFQPVRRGQLLATDRRGEVHAPLDGLIFMPLYQPEGEEGFFIAAPLETRKSA